MPTSSAKERARRVILIELALEMHSKFIGLDDDISTTLVMMTIRMGVYQKRPLDVSGIAAATSLPRTTVVRHVKALEKLGRVKVINSGRRAIPILTGIERPIVKAFYNDLERLIRLAASNLSKMDS